MFKSWRSDKKKIKLVFRLQFQATQVPKVKKSGVMISLVPEDVGKPTLKLEKVAVQDGTCLWENPVFETVKFIWEPKTGRMSEKIYHFVVSTGSSKSGFLGEASIDFADFATENEPITVSLPLKFANSGVVLHVTILRMQGPDDPRYLEEGEDLVLSREGSLQSQENGYNGYGIDQNFGEGFGAEENGSFGAANGTNQEKTFYSSYFRQNSLPQNGTKDAADAKSQMHKRTKTDWSVGSASDGSLVESNNNSPEDVQRACNATSVDSVEKLTGENKSLMRQAEFSELELQALRKQITKESERTQEMARQIIGLKEERDALRKKFEQLKLQRSSGEVGTENEEMHVQLEEVRHELNYEKDINANLRMQLQKAQDSNSNFILAVRDLNEMLEEKNRKISELSSEMENRCNAENGGKKNSDEIDILKQMIAELNAEIDACTQNKEDLEMHMAQLTRENEELKQEKYDFSLKLQRNQQELKEREVQILESLPAMKELEAQVQSLENKVKQQSEEYSESLITINELNGQIKELRKELETQAQSFQDDFDAMIRAKTKQEQRAIRAEETLRQVRSKNATAEQLQEEFKRCSEEMAAELDEKEKAVAKAEKEASELNLQKRDLEEMLQKANEELRFANSQSEVKIQDLTDQLDLKEKQILQMLREKDYKTMLLEDAQTNALKKDKAFTTEIQTLKTEMEKLRKKSFMSTPREAGLRGERKREPTSSKGLKASGFDTSNEANLVEVLNEVAALKEKNKSMEQELKDMQERYSEVSLRFAEVEGERQELVMTVRNLKNGKN